MQSEIQIQAAFFQWAWNEHPQTRRCLFSVPNGGTRDIREAGQLKASGMLAGVSDMILLWLGKAYCIEFKKPGGVQSMAQKLFEQAVSPHAEYVLFDNLEDAQRWFDKIVIT